MIHSNGSQVKAPSERTQEFYSKVLQVLNEHDVRYMVGGSYAAAYYTGRPPHTKDLDIFLPPAMADTAIEVIRCAGYEVVRPYEFWLAKAFDGEEFVDIIYRAASGLWEIQDEWVERAHLAAFWQVPVRVCAVEELVWTKAALMDRDRYDGNDVLHLLQAKAHVLDWDRLRHLAGDSWRILLSHLTMFGYVYPDLVPLVPRHLLAELALRLMSDRSGLESDVPNGELAPLCRGTLVSNSQYIIDVEELGYRDARLRPWGRLEPEELAPWIDAVKRGET
jgi:hypothetical protein